MTPYHSVINIVNAIKKKFSEKNNKYNNDLKVLDQLCPMESDTSIFKYT